MLDASLGGRFSFSLREKVRMRVNCLIVAL
jgi:hypothetical protein